MNKKLLIFGIIIFFVLVIGMGIAWTPPSDILLRDYYGIENPERCVGDWTPLPSCTYDLGTAVREWEDLYLCEDIIMGGDIHADGCFYGECVNVTGNVTAGDCFYGECINVTGNVTAGGCFYGECVDVTENVTASWCNCFINGSNIIGNITATINNSLHWCGWNCTYLETHYLNLSGGNANQNINISPYNFTASWCHCLTNASNIQNEYWVNEAGDTMTGNLNMSGNNITNVNYGFFTYLGSLINRITSIFVGSIDATGNINTTGNMTASNFFGNLNASYIQNDPWIEDSQESSLNVNSSDWWRTNEGHLKNVADILGSWINNDLNWINSTHGNTSIWSRAGTFIFPTNIGDWVGIGTSSPSQLLEIENRGGSARFNIDSGDGVTPRYSEIYFSDNDAIKWRFSKTSENDFRIYSDDLTANVFFIDNDTGNVGIGTSSPQEKLHVDSGRIKSSGSSTVWSSVSGLILNDTRNHADSREWGIYGGAAKAGALVFRVGSNKWNSSGLVGSTKMVIDKDGKVGIGTNNPAGALEVVGLNSIFSFTSTGPTNSNLYLHQDGDAIPAVLSYPGAWNPSLVLVGIDGSRQGWLTIADDGFYMSSNTSIVFATDDDATPIERMRILTDGKVGIGTVSPGAKLEVAGNIIVQNNGIIYPASTGDLNLRSGSAGHVKFWAEYAGTETRPNAKFEEDASGNTELLIAGSARITDTDANEYGKVRYISGGSPYFEIYSAQGDTVLGMAGNVGIGIAIPTEKLQVSGNIFMTTDNNKMLFGTAKDASIYYDGADLYIDTQEVGAGDLIIPNGDVIVNGNLGLNVQQLTCIGGNPCDESVSAILVRDSCPAGYIVTGCSPYCEDAAGLDECYINLIDIDTCEAGCADTAAGSCTVSKVNLICMRITDIGDA